MIHVILESAALGIAGFDPMGFFVLIGALSMRASRASVATLLATTLGLTFVFGFVPARTVGPAMLHLLDRIHGVDRRVWAAVAIAAGLALLGAWAWRVITAARSARRPQTATDESVAPVAAKHAPRSATVLGLAGAGVLVALSAFIDPAFYGIIAYASDHRTRTASAVSVAVWIVFSHSALVVCSLLVLAGVRLPLDEYVDRLRTRFAPHLRALTNLALLVGGLIVLAEGAAKWHHDWIWPHLH